MDRSPPGWRKLRAIFAALLLAVLAFGPSLDQLICKDDAGLSAAAAESVPHDRQDSDAHAGDPGACLHGHCHHGASGTPRISDGPQPPLAERAAHDLRREPDPPGGPRPDLLRPPRA